MRCVAWNPGERIKHWGSVIFQFRIVGVHHQRVRRYASNFGAQCLGARLTNPRGGNPPQIVLNFTCWWVPSIAKSILVHHGAQSSLHPSLFFFAHSEKTTIRLVLHDLPFDILPALASAISGRRPLFDPYLYRPVLTPWAHFEDSLSGCRFALRATTEFSTPIALFDAAVGHLIPPMVPRPTTLLHRCHSSSSFRPSRNPYW